MKIYPIFKSAVEIKCRIPGLQPTDVVSWEYEGIPLIIEPEQVILMDNDQTLWIKSFQPSDVGRYTCKANGYQWSIYLNGYSTGKFLEFFLSRYVPVNIIYRGIVCILQV